MPSHRPGRMLPEGTSLESGDQGAVFRGMVPEAMQVRAAREVERSGAMSLHVSKLRGISLQIRNKLKRQGISYTHQLLQHAGSAERRRQLAANGRIDEAVLERLVQRADLARIKGVGAIFADMLEHIGVTSVSVLAEQDPTELHRVLYELNAEERMARRAPTPEEVQDWVAQARVLPHVVDHD